MPDVADIATELTEYEQLMARAFELQQERNQLVSQSSELGRKARQQLTQIMETALLDNDAEASSRAGLAASNLLLARLYLEKFLVDNREEDFTRSASEIANARSGMQTLLEFLENPRRRELANLTIADLDGFDALSNSISDTITARNAAYEEMDRIGPSALQKMETIIDNLTERQDVLGPVGQAKAERSILIILSIVVLGTILGCILATLTGRSISKELQRVTDTMSELASGNLDISLERSDKTHEIGKMTNAMVVFLQNAQEARQLDEQVKQKEQEERDRAREEQQREAAALKEKEVAREKELKVERERMQAFKSFQEQMDGVLTTAAAGNFAVRMDTATAPDDLRALGSLVNGLLGAMEENLSDVASGLAKLAKGDLGIRITGDRSGSFARMQNDFNSALQQLADTLADITKSGQTVSSNSNEVENASLVMSKRAEDNAASVEETSAAVEEISASIKQVVESARTANEATQRMRTNAVESRRVADETEASISALTEASAKISGVVKVIEDIAFQINLLALNAGVEAARAGEAGRGFSVVASEVRSLAQRSQEAVQEIGKVIAENNRTVETGVKQVGASRAALSTIADEIEVTSNQISDITAAVEEQSTGIQEVSTAIQTIDQMAQSNAASLEEMTASSVSLNQESSSLEQALSKFHGIDISEARRPQIEAVPQEPQVKAAHQNTKVAVNEKVAGSTSDGGGWEDF